MHGSPKRQRLSKDTPFKKWQRLGRRWQSQCQIDKTKDCGPAGSWLQPRHVGDAFSVGCKVCADAGLKTVWACFDVRSNSHLQLVNIKRHDRSSSHKSAMLKAMGDPSTVLSCLAPPREDFEKLIEEQQKGISFNASSVGSCKKAIKMTWCLAEALRDLDKAFCKNISDLALHSDGSGRILRAYFNACNKLMNTRQGIFGSVRDSGSTAHEIADSIIKICNKFCSSRAHPPYHHKQASIGDLDEELLELIRNALVVFNGDAASNEQLAGRILQGRTPIKGVLQGYFKNMLAVGRDPTHASTRLRHYHCQFVSVCVGMSYAWERN